MVNIIGLFDNLITKPTRDQQPWVLSNLPQSFVLKVINPQEVVFVGKIKALASVNIDGEFDVLPGHTNFISIVNQRVWLYHLDNKRQELKIDVGVLRFVNNQADLYLGLEFTQVESQLEQLVPSESVHILAQMNHQSDQQLDQSQSASSLGTTTDQDRSHQTPPA